MCGYQCSDGLEVVGSDSRLGVDQGNGGIDWRRFGLCLQLIVKIHGRTRHRFSSCRGGCGRNGGEKFDHLGR